MKRLIIMTVVQFILSFFLALSISAKPISPTLDNKPKKESALSSISDSNSISNTLHEAKKHFQKALEFSQSGMLDSAIREYRKTLELDPNLSMAYVNLGMSYVQKKEYDAAIDELKKAIEKEPGLKIAHLNLWWALRQKGKYDEGISELKKAMAIDPNDINIYQNLGDSYLSDKKQISEAISIYLQGLAKDRNNLSIYQKLGKAYELNKEWKKAAEQFQECIKLHKDNPYNYLFLYITLKKAGKDSEAKDIIQKSLTTLRDISPSQAGYSIGESIHLLEYLAGTYSEKDLLSSQNPVITCQSRYYIGMNCLFNHKTKEAIEHLQQAVDSKMDFISEYEYAKIELEQMQSKK